MKFDSTKTLNSSKVKKMAFQSLALSDYHWMIKVQFPLAFQDTSFGDFFFPIFPVF
jgi:hypothetical protein